MNSRAVPGWRAIVSLLANRERCADEWYGAPEVPNGIEITGMDVVEKLKILKDRPDHIPVLCIDLEDGRSGLTGPTLSTATGFIAYYVRTGCVLVHCGAGYSRSVAVMAAYFCRYMGMRLDHAVDYIKEMRQGACPAPIFWQAITEWIKLDELATKGPRR